MEVIARRYNRTLWLYALYDILGAGLITGGSFLIKESLAAALALFTIGGAVLFFGIFLTVLVLRTPNEVIRHDGKSLYFPDFTCKVWEPFEVNFSTPSKETYGTLYVRVAGAERKYRFVADVEKVCEALKAIKSRSKKERDELK